MTVAYRQEHLFISANKMKGFSPLFFSELLSLMTHYLFQSINLFPQATISAICFVTTIAQSQMQAQK